MRASGIALGAVRATYFDTVDRPSQTQHLVRRGSVALRRSRSAFGRPALFLDFQNQNPLSAAHETCGREAQEGSRVFSLNAPVSFPSLRNIAGHAAFQRPNETIATGFVMRKNLLSILGLIRKRRCAKRAKARNWQLRKGPRLN